MRLCAVAGCYRLPYAHGLCRNDYERARYRLRRDGRPLQEMTAADAGMIRYDDPGFGVCQCELPQPDGIGQCTDCWRPVVTFMRLRDEDPADVWPTEHARATRLGLVPSSTIPH